MRWPYDPGTAPEGAPLKLDRACSGQSDAKDIKALALAGSEALSARYKPRSATGSCAEAGATGSGIRPKQLQAV